jgi:hypothetical protein
LLLAGLFLVALLAALPGCAGDRSLDIREDHEPIGTQLLRAVPALKEDRFNALLDFESNDDAIFCSTVGGSGAIATDKPHTGRAAYKIDAATQRFSIKLSSLLAGRKFPDTWTLAGGYFYTEQPTKITIGFQPAMKGCEPRDVDLPGGEWTAVFAELPADFSPQTVPSLVFDLKSPHGSVWCDDVLLIDNYKVLTSPSEDSAASPASAAIAPSSVFTADVAAGVMPPWLVLRRGLNFLGSAPGRFDFKLVTDEFSTGGWEVNEANPMRARFHAVVGPSSPAPALTIYADGRAFLNGQYKPMSVAARDPMLAQQHQSPAQIEVADGMGRVDRNTPGDANNDGYNETTGSYRIIAFGPRIELRFIPSKSPELSPILEFSGLPFGNALVTLEGRLVEKSTRTSSGTLLVELPARIDRPVTVDVRIEE